MKLKNVDFKDLGVRIAGTFVGIAAGSLAKDAISSNSTVEGLAGEATGYLAPALVSLAGAVVSAAMDDKFMKSAGFGITASGAATIVNKIAGKSVVSLSGTGKVGKVGNVGKIGATRMPRRVPARINGVGSIMPGVGRTETIQSQLPGMAGCF